MQRTLCGGVLPKVIDLWEGALGVLITMGCP